MLIALILLQHVPKPRLTLAEMVTVNPQAVRFWFHTLGTCFETNQLFSKLNLLKIDKIKGTALLESQH